jgi:hypothetical protein
MPTDPPPIKLTDQLLCKTLNKVRALPSASVQLQNRTIDQRLAKLEQMRADGVIDGLEYQRRRQAVIDEI